LTLSSPAPQLERRIQDRMASGPRVTKTGDALNQEPQTWPPCKQGLALFCDDGDEDADRATVSMQITAYDTLTLAQREAAEQRTNLHGWFVSCGPQRTNPGALGSRECPPLWAHQTHPDHEDGDDALVGLFHVDHNGRIPALSGRGNVPPCGHMRLIQTMGYALLRPIPRTGQLYHS
jgi:hypothetical protein